MGIIFGALPSKARHAGDPRGRAAGCRRVFDDGSRERMSNFIQNLSQRLFWDVDPETINDDLHRRYVIQRVLERGSLSDLRLTIDRYTLPLMIAEAQQMRPLDPVTLAFAACLGNVKEESFRCFASKQ